jgi:hypothetical protein
MVREPRRRAMQIFPVLFSILTIAGAWAGWRRSPLYSVKTTLKVAGAFLLIVAAIVGGSIAILNGPILFSPTAQAILGGIGILAIGIGATAGIIRITDAHVAQLPPSVRIVTTERHKVQRWIWRTFVYLLVSAAAAMVLWQSMWAVLFLTPASLVLVGCGPMLMALYMKARRLDMGMSSVVAAPWAHWQYTAEQWESWANKELEWERSKEVKIVWRQEWRKKLKPAATMVLIFLGCAWVAVPGSAGDKLAAAGFGVTCLVAVAVCVQWANRGACERRYRKLLAVPREAWFGDEGVFCNGKYAQWELSGSYLLEATAPRDPSACVQLVFRNVGGAGPAREIKRVPIPEGRASDLAVLQKRMREQCPTAAIQLVAGSR